MKLDDDDFTLFGLPPRHALDRTELDRRWRALQSEVHPDRFAAAGSAAQRVAMQWTLRVNEAYQRLKDPVQRGAYLCGLRGAPVDTQINTAMPAAFLVQQMQWRESLDEATTRDAVLAIDGGVAATERRLLAELAASLDAGAGDVPAAAERVRALMFVQRFRRDIERRLDDLPT